MLGAGLRRPAGTPGASVESNSSGAPDPTVSTGAADRGSQLRISREKLLELAQKEAEQRADTGDVFSGYVIGSLAAGDPLIGGTADIDLVLIHEESPELEREIVPLSEQVHLDVLHHPRSLYAEPRELRHHPWLGPAISEPAFLYDPEHFFEWAQAAVRGQFQVPENRHARGVAFLGLAGISLEQMDSDGRWRRSYLNGVLEAANSVAVLSGLPAAGRGLVLQLHDKLAALDQERFFVHFQQGLGADQIEPERLAEWVSAWARAFDAAAGRSFDPELEPSRREYYLRAFHSLMDEDRGPAVLWPLLWVWERAMNALEMSGAAGPHDEIWNRALEALQLDEQHRERRRAGLEQMVDEGEEVLELFAEQMGV